MKKLLSSSSEINKRVLVLTESTDGAVDWVDAAATDTGARDLKKPEDVF